LAFCTLRSAFLAGLAGFAAALCRSRYSPAALLKPHRSIAAETAGRHIDGSGSGPARGGADGPQGPSAPYLSVLVAADV